MENNQTVPLRNGRKLFRALKAKSDARRTLPEKFADFMTKTLGTTTFLILNFLVFAWWITVNIGWIPGAKVFDPFPFVLLTTTVSLEAIFLSIIVLISQKRAGKVDDLREEVDLYIDIISEQEVTKILEVVAEIAKQNNIDLSKDRTLKKMLQKLDTEKIETVLETQI
jgi:uncharacterized membrane protein